MESKGRRPLRAAPAVEAVAPSDRAVEIPAASVEPVVPESEAPKPAEILAETAEPAQTAVNLAMAAAATESPQPSTGATMRAASTAPAAVDQFGREAIEALAQSQAALAHGLGALSAEMAGLTLSGIDTATRAATKMLGVKTISDAIDVNAGLTCSSLDAVVSGSARLSELGVKLATETSQPILIQFGKCWVKAARFGAE